MGRVLDATAPQKVSYAIPLWLRDEQIKLNITRVSRRLQPPKVLSSDPIAVVCFGPSLNDTWEQIKNFTHIISCSGSHKFLVDRGIIPTWHLEVDPRPHKVKLIGTPHPDVEYLIASTCHPDVVDHLQNFKITLWHVFDTAEEGQRILPPGEWAVTGGCSVGLRAMTMARFLGFTDLHIFGMDGSDSASHGAHAAEHPNQAKDRSTTVYKGVTYSTTPAFLEAARTTFYELDQMADVHATFYGEGLVQHMARDYTPKKNPKGDLIAFEKPELISPAYRDLNAQLHRSNLAYGVGAGRHAPTVLKLAATLKTQSILDYGCGKGYLAKEIPFPIWEYDPAIEGKSATPRPAELVCCLDVLEHIEPEKLKYVLKDLKRCVKNLGYFVINTGPAKKTLPDGRNTHLIQENEAWWRTALSNVFTVAKIWPVGAALHVLVQPLVVKKKKAVSAESVSVISERTLKLSFGQLAFRRDPYVIGAAREVLDAAHYDELTASFPTDLTLYKKFVGGDEKYSLSERNNPETYADFVEHSLPWKAFHEYIKAPAFTEKVLAVLGAHRIGGPAAVAPLRPRFEFSMLPAAGGLLRPHTDLTSKVVTIVLSMRGREEAWEEAWGGGTDVLVPKDGATYADYEAPLEAFDVMHTFPYLPNQAVVFIKTATSWHSVGPLAGPAEKFRRTVTINLERV